MLMLLADVTQACGSDPNPICRITFEQTNNEWLSAIIVGPASALVIIVIAWFIVRVLRRQIPRTAKAYITARETDNARHARANLSEDQKIQRSLRKERARQRANTLGAVFVSIASGLVWSVAAMLMLDQFGVSLAPLLAGAGVVGIALGFGAQQMVKDFVAGVFIIMEDQYGVGDIVDLGEASGTVEQLSLRVTRLRDVSGVVWYVPNGEIRRVGNTSKLWSTALLDIDVGYSTDLDQAGEILKRVAVQLWEENLEAMTIIAEPEFVGVQHFGADGVTLRLVAKTEPAEQWAVARELRRRIKFALDEAGIEIPFPQRTLWVHQAEAD